MNASQVDRMIPTRSGRPIAASRLSGETVLAHDTANELVAAAEALRETTRAAKERFYQTVDAYVDLVLDRYQVKLGGRRGGVGICSFDETSKVEVSTADYQRLNAAIIAAQALTNEILDDLTAGANADLRTLITEAFSRDERTGRINIQRVMGLTRLQLQHPRWADAVRAIRDAIEPAGSRRYIRFYRRETAEHPWQQVDLNFSSLPLVG